MSGNKIIAVTNSKGGVGKTTTGVFDMTTAVHGLYETEDSQ